MTYQNWNNIELESKEGLLLPCTCNQKRTFTFNEYHVLRDLVLHFLYKFGVTTFINGCKGIFSIF